MTSIDPFGLVKSCTSIGGTHKKTGATYKCDVCLEILCQDGDFDEGEWTFECTTNKIKYTQHPGWRLGEPWAEARNISIGIESNSLGCKDEKCPACVPGKVSFGRKGKCKGKATLTHVSGYDKYVGAALVHSIEEVEQSSHDVELTLKLNCCGYKDLCEG